MITCTNKLLTAAVLLLAASSVHAQALNLTAKANSLTTTLDALGLPVIILAIMVSVFGYLFKLISMEWAGRVAIGGIVFGSAAEIAAFLLA